MCESAFRLLIVTGIDVTSQVMTLRRLQWRKPKLGQNFDDVNIPKVAPWFTDLIYDVIIFLGQAVFEFPAKN